MLPSLYESGWRQGSVFTAELTAPIGDLVDGEVKLSSSTFTRWVVCTQDCDLAWATANRTELLVEIRPVLLDSPPAEWGVRSRAFRLNDRDYISNDFPRALITPAVLASMNDRREYNLDGSRALAFKAWLGRRYDRPAVPEPLVEVAREIARLCSRRQDRSIAEDVHDVLIQFDSADPPGIKLFGIATTSAVIDDVREWLSRAATGLSPTLGIVTGIEAGTKADISLELVEQSYSADLSQLTWRGQDPTGAIQ